MDNKNQNDSQDVLPPLPPEIKAPAAPVAKKPIQVKATQPGYYDHRRIEVGQKFNIKEDQEFSANWMIDLSGRLPLPKEEKAVKKSK
jgi:hypothetical protein